MRKLIFFLLISLSLQAIELKGLGGKLKESAKDFLSLFDIDEEMPVGELVPHLKDRWVQENLERWEMEGLFEEMKEKALPYLRNLGCIDTIYAETDHYNYALVLGAIGKTMQRRLDFLYEEWQRGVTFDQIVLLSGERDLDPARESYPEGLKTETDLFVYLFENHPLYGIAPHLIIDAPKVVKKSGKIRRPTTASTVKEWLATRPAKGSCLAISTQPFVGYQEAVIKLFLPKGFSVEGVGPGTENMYQTANLDIEGAPNAPYPMAIYLDNFAKWLDFENQRGQQ